MPYLRDSVPVRAAFTAIKAYLERTFSSLDGWSQTVDAQIANLIRVAELNGVVISWLWDDDLDTTVDPGAGNMRANNNVMSAMTQFSMSGIDVFGRDLDGSRLEFIGTGDFVEVADKEKSADFLYVMDSDIVNNGSWFQMNVTPIDGGSANPTQGDIMEVKWLPNLSDPVGPAGF